MVFFGFIIMIDICNVYYEVGCYFLVKLEDEVMVVFECIEEFIGKIYGNVNNFFFLFVCFGVC